MASRRIEDLHPDMQPKAVAFERACNQAGLPILIYMTYRSNAEQDALYAKGRTLPGSKVTNAKGGMSDHNFTLNGKPASKAFDAVPTQNGKPVWNNAALWDKMGALAKSVGLKWGGDWKKFVDKPHCYI